ncbi:MAG: ABC transporter ATP-binding protein [Candidatus Bathyarchaeia archaeon]
MLEIKNLDVCYGYLQVLWGVSLEVREGEIVTVCGPNGAGKTTLLKTISGLLSPSSGSIIFMGKRIDDLPPYQIVKMGISHVFQGRRLFALLTVRENLELGAYFQHGEEKRKFFGLVYDIFPILKERERQLAGTLSGGEQQMLAIGRALMSNPKLLMLDEPSSGLAPLVVDRIFDVIKRLNEDGITILLVEQNVYQSLRLADRAHVLENGKVILNGEGKKLLSNEYVQKSYLGM